MMEPMQIARPRLLQIKLNLVIYMSSTYIKLIFNMYIHIVYIYIYIYMNRTYIFSCKVSVPKECTGKEIYLVNMYTHIVTYSYTFTYIDMGQYIVCIDPYGYCIYT